MRFLYNLLTYLLLIPFAFYWLIKGIGNRSYVDRLSQRFGFGFPKIDRCIWVHAVSVGEVQAAVPLGWSDDRQLWWRDGYPKCR